MLKKILLASLILFGCDKGTEPEVRSEIPVPSVRTVVSDTVLIKKKVISGRIIEKNSSGKNIGAFSAIVCSDSKKTCVETDSDGEYYMSFESPVFKVSARSLKNEDSLFDTIKTKKDSVNVDTTATVTKIDSTQKDTIKITYRKYVPQSEPDTVIVWKDSKKIYEQPISSWLNILPDNYVVQRNISGKIIQNDYVKELKKVEGVFWSTDSIALVIPLEVNGEMYSGFAYQHYNDSSFKNAIRMYNLFVRLMDTADSVYGLSNILNYSERSGDLAFSDILPGGIARYPRPNYFQVIKDGSDVSIIVDSVQKISVNKKWYALDSLYNRQTYKEVVNVYESGEVMTGYVGKLWSRFVLDTASRNVVKNLSDSIGFMIEAKEEGYIYFLTPSWPERFAVTKGTNFISLPKIYAKDLEVGEGDFNIYGKVTKFKIYLHLK